MEKQITGKEIRKDMEYLVKLLHKEWERSGKTKAREGEIDSGSGTRTPEESLNLAEQLQAANKRIKELEKSNRELKELNEFLEEASAFFAASRRKSGKKND